MSVVLEDGLPGEGREEGHAERGPHQCQYLRDGQPGEGCGSLPGASQIHDGCEQAECGHEGQRSVRESPHDLAPALDRGPCGQ